MSRALQVATTPSVQPASVPPEARELAELLTTGGFSTDLALLQEAIRAALEDAPP
jgi:hypothetical protein